MSIRVLIVDDHEVVRLGLRSALEIAEDIELAGTASTVEEAVRSAETLKPDVVLMDVRLGPEGDSGGVEACREIRNESPTSKVLMFSSFSDRAAVEASILAGASGYLTKNLGLSQLLDALRAAARGESPLDPAVTAPVLEQLRRLSLGEGPPEHALSEREREVLALVAQGLTNAEIAGQLHVSAHTVRNHVTNILGKLGVSRRVEAATLAIKEGIIDQGS
jgi:two-component system response regulator DevR